MLGNDLGMTTWFSQNCRQMFCFTKCPLISISTSIVMNHPAMANGRFLNLFLLSNFAVGSYIFWHWHNNCLHLHQKSQVIFASFYKSSSTDNFPSTFPNHTVVINCASTKDSLLWIHENKNLTWFTFMHSKERTFAHCTGVHSFKKTFSETSSMRRSWCDTHDLNIRQCFDFAHVLCASNAYKREWIYGLFHQRKLLPKYEPDK